MLNIDPAWLEDAARETPVLGTLTQDAIADAVRTAAEYDSLLRIDDSSSFYPAIVFGAPNDATLMWIGDSAGPLVTLKRDGTVELSDRYQPVAAARIFWETLARFPFAPNAATPEAGAAQVAPWDLTPEATQQLSRALVSKLASADDAAVQEAAAACNNFIHMAVLNDPLLDRYAGYQIPFPPLQPFVPPSSPPPEPAPLPVDLPYRYFT